MVYGGWFGSWQDVERYFELESGSVVPDQVYLAVYDESDAGYDGYADVVYRIGDRYFRVQGSHCSCYGLEGQWEPEEYSREEFLGALSRDMHFWCGESAEVRAELRQLISEGA